MNPIVKVENLSKRYRIGTRPDSYSTLREMLVGVWRAPLKRLRGNGASSNDTIWALKNVNFEIQTGEVVGIIGRNGAGKSTLLKVLSRITKPTRGRVQLFGRVGSLLEVGTGFHPELTGRENIFLNGAILGMGRVEIVAKFDEIVAFAGVERFIDTPVKHFSSGMYLRLAFAVAAHLEPEILIVDEVLAVGDMDFQRKCLKKMEDVGKHGRTVIFVSHNMPAITRLCQRAILLDHGTKLLDGRSSAVVSNYLSLGLSTAASREWTDINNAPGNEFARLCGVRLLNRTGIVCDTFDVREPIDIEIVYYNFANERFAYANIQLFDENDNLLFASGDFTNLEWRHKARTFEGKVRSTCTIPGNLLAEGQLRVLVALTTHNPSEVLAIERDAVSFMVVDNSEGDGARGEYGGSFPGLIRPLLNWEVDVSPKGQSTAGSD